MFGRKKMYKQGLAHAMQAYEGFAEKQKAALDVLRQEVRAGNMRLEEALSGLGEDINGVYDYLTSKEKAALYQLSTPLDLKELEDEERRLLLAVLYQLADDEGASVTDAQRTYIRSVQIYLDITNPQVNIDLSVVGNIDSLEIQKVFLQVALEFFYLQDQGEITDKQEDFLGYFSVNRKQAELIENRVGRLYNVVGAEGLAEKYGYVATEVPKDITEESFIKTVALNVDEIKDSVMSIIGPKLRFTCDLVETENYLFISTGDKGEIIDKTIGSSLKVDCSEKLGISIGEAFKYEATPDTVLIHNYALNAVELIYLAENRREKVLTNFSDESSILVTANHYFVYAVPFSRNRGNHHIYVVDIETQEVKEVPIPFGTKAYRTIAAMSDDYLCLWAGDPSLGGDQNIVLNLIDYKNDLAIKKQFSIYTSDLQSTFGYSDEVVSWYDPKFLIVNKNKILIIFNSRLRSSPLYRLKMLFVDLSSKPDGLIIEEYNFGQTVPLSDACHVPFFAFDGKLFVSSQKEWSDECYGLFYVDLETRNETILIPSNSIDKFSRIFRIQNYIYFISGNHQQYRVNIGHPGAIENAF